MKVPRQHTVDTPYMVGPVHCYTLETGTGLILFDTGPPTDTGRDYLQRHLDLARLQRVVITHCHVDHYGQAGWLEEHSDAAFYLPRRDILKVRGHAERVETMAALFGEMGFDAAFCEELCRLFNRTTFHLPAPDRCHVAEDDLPAGLGIEVFACPGHSQSDLVYSGNGWAVTGDTLLQGIYQSPLLDIDPESGARFDNYAAYCTSIVTLAGFRDKLILPGHRETVDGVDETIEFYVAKTLRRVRQLRPQLESWAVAEIMERLFGSMRDPFHIYLKSSEIVFMQDFLERPGLLHGALAEIGLLAPLADRFSAALSD